jgi:Zn-dependent peptidase ImmA (M78 family)
MGTFQELLNSRDALAIDRFQKSAPINVVNIAKAFGINVYYDDLPEGISGKIVRDPDHGGSSGFSIIVNGAEAFTRKRFTIAHEIAHFLLHRDRIGDGLTDDALYRSGLSTSAEVRANKLAADILMPYRLIEDAVRSGINNVDQLAEKFKVSQQAMKVRLEIAT